VCGNEEFNNDIASLLTAPPKETLKSASQASRNGQFQTLYTSLHQYGFVTLKLLMQVNMADVPAWSNWLSWLAHAV
jgi:hypothetical protein